MFCLSLGFRTFVFFSYSKLSCVHFYLLKNTKNPLKMKTLNVEFLAAKAQLNACTCSCVCLSVSKLNFSLFTPLYTTEHHCTKGMF